MATIISTGSCGDNATYNLYDDGLLEILGTGAMTDYQYSTSTYTTTAPWAEYRYSNPIKTITIAEGITTIGDYAFCNCATSLTSITIPNTVTSIGRQMLAESNALTGLTIPSSVTTIKSDAFRNCSSLKKLTMLGAVPTTYSPFLVGTPMYGGKGKIYVPYAYVDAYKVAEKWKDYANLIGGGGTSLAELFRAIANSIRKISGNTENIVAYDFPTKIDELPTNNYSSVLSSGEATFTEDVPSNAFDVSNITKITIKNGVEVINSGAFENCTAVETVTVADTVTNIDNYAFSGCSSLMVVKLGKGVTEILDEVFLDCSSLTELYLYNEDGVVTASESAFSSTSLTTVYVPEALVDAYYEDENWSQYDIQIIS